MKEMNRHDVLMGYSLTFLHPDIFMECPRVRQTHVSVTKVTTRFAKMLLLDGMGFQILRHPEIAKQNTLFLSHTLPNKTNFQAFRVCKNLHAVIKDGMVNFPAESLSTAAKVCFNSGIGTLSLSITKPWLLTVAALLKLGGRGHGVNMGQQTPDVDRWCVSWCVQF